MKHIDKIGVILIGIGLLYLPNANAQQYFKNIIPYQNHISLTSSNGTHIRAEITSKSHPEDYLTSQTWYYWYHKDTIIHAQGTYYGKLLHGDYKEFFSNWKPKVAGQFSFGQKIGKWMYWDENGVLRKTSRWKKSQESGPFFLYNEKGFIIQKGRMKNGQLQGNIKTYSMIDSIKATNQTYKKGKPQTKEKKLSKLYDKFKSLF